MYLVTKEFKIILMYINNFLEIPTGIAIATAAVGSRLPKIATAVATVPRDSRFCCHLAAWRNLTHRNQLIAAPTVTPWATSPRNDTDK